MNEALSSSRESLTARVQVRSLHSSFRTVRVTIPAVGNRGMLLLSWISAYVPALFIPFPPLPPSLTLSVSTSDTLESSHMSPFLTNECKRNCHSKKMGATRRMENGRRVVHVHG